MKTLILIVFFLSASCASRKTQIKRYIDEAMSIRQNTQITALGNTKLSEGLTVPFRVVEYDTAGRITKETTGEIRKERQEERQESISRQDSLGISSAINTREQIKEKKSRSWQYAVIGSAAALFLVFIIYILARRAK